MPKPRVVMKFGKPYVWVTDPDTGKLVLLPLNAKTEASSGEMVVPGGVGPMPGIVREAEVEIRE
jgi:hypothetical protein